MLFTYKVAVGLHIATAIRVGQHLGSGKADEAKTVAHISILAICKQFLYDPCDYTCV